MSPDQRSYEAAAAAASTGIILMMVFGLAVAVFMAIVYWKIFSKAGFSGALGLLMFVPIANIIVLCVLAFGKWPVLQELDLLRQRSGMVAALQYPPQAIYPPPQAPYLPPQPTYSQQPPSYPQY